MSVSEILVLRRVLVAERGPLAGYLIRSMRALGFETVAMAPPGGEDLTYLREADYAVVATCPEESFRELLLEVANDAGCDGIHPGYGPLAEDAEFARRVAASNLKFVGPQIPIVEALSDRWVVREIGRSAGVKVLPGSEAIEEKSQILDAIEEVGLPCWVKDDLGREPELVHEESRCPAAVSERFMSGAHRVWLEKHIDGARHLVASCVWEAGGDSILLAVRERAVRNDRRLTIDEAPAVISENTLEAIRRAAIRFGELLNYQGLGSVGFIVDPSGSCYCIGFRSRLQVGDQRIGRAMLRTATSHRRSVWRTTPGCGHTQRRVQRRR